MRAAVLMIGCLVGALVLAVLAVPEGEVVTLSTFSPDGAEHQTDLWVVDGSSLPGTPPGDLYVRAHSKHAGWLERLRGQPAVELLRDGTARPYRGEVAGAEAREEVNRAMAEKYGVSDRLLGWLIDPRESVPVLLVPDPTRSAARESDGAHGRPH